MILKINGLTYFWDSLGGCRTPTQFSENLYIKGKNQIDFCLSELNFKDNQIADKQYLQNFN